MLVACDLVLDCRAIVRMTLGSADDRFLTSAEIRLGKSADADLADAIFVKA
jgi:hypothetical protein